MHRIGIMQGRLSPICDGKIQAFPKTNWQNEFALAKKIGFELIEWVIDTDDYKHNPILSSLGRREINKLKNEFQIEVPGICCDYFMDISLQGHEIEERIKAKGMLIELLRVCPEVGIRYIELPLINKSSINNDEKAIMMACLMNDIHVLAEKFDINFVLEVDLSPQKIVGFMEKVTSSRVQINYDTGNSVYWGFNPQDEIPLYGHKIGNVHIKDCTHADYSVPLGEGDTDFKLIFQLLKEIGYNKDFILQTARGDDDVNIAKKSFEFTKHHINKFLL